MYVFIQLIPPCHPQFISVGRDPDWIDLNTRYILDLAKAGIFLGLLPKFIRP